MHVLIFACFIYTAFRAVAVSAKLEEQIITCDHPFLFYLMHKRNLVLFAGKFSDPRIERINL
jgi:serine protease inhibitor